MLVEDNGRAKRVFYDYRDVGGILQPHLVVTVVDKGEPPHLFVVDEVKLDPPLAEDVFRDIRSFRTLARYGHS